MQFQKRYLLRSIQSAPWIFWILAAALWLTAQIARSEELPLIGNFRNTYYYVVVESEYAKYPKDADVLDREGNSLIRVSSRFKKAMDIEGSGRLMDGRVLNFAGVVADESGTRTIRYRFTKNPYGDGVKRCPLEPFHTIAVDPTEIPLGTTVRIEETVGMLLPDGTRHDGLWRARDVGGAIKKDRIDLFLGDGNIGHVLSQHGIKHLQALTLRQVSPPAADDCAALLEDEESQ